ncbi:hypothetical protein B0J13DRAFT_573023 [Dactylonectria estremocensis]|uniref:Uncharacterized protein n=1 Tax=Dactylonectria estremocensis TaxID=1079267 RepID=A0A9P9D8U6_9HYPO|nr:hypothetical protein B0J13DRAFT_573023 [Dactylonectria estremocensis]
MAADVLNLPNYDKFTELNQGLNPAYIRVGQTYNVPFTDVNPPATWMTVGRCTPLLELNSDTTTSIKENSNIRTTSTAEIDGVMKKVPKFMTWLELTGQKDDFLDMETTSQKYLDLLGQRNDGFIIDTKPDPRIQAAIRKLKYASKPLSEAAELTALHHDNNENSFSPKNEEYNKSESGDDDDIEIITASQELRSWERSSPPVTWAEEVDDGPETPCPQPRTQHHQSTYKHIKKGLETFRDRLRKREDSCRRDTI